MSTEEYEHIDIDSEAEAIEEGWGDEVEESKSFSNRLKNAIPAGYAKPMISMGVILVGAIAVMLLISSTGGKSADDRVSGVKTDLKDIPQDSITAGDLLGSEAPEAVAIQEAKDEAFIKAADTGVSSVSDLNFFDEAKMKQDEAVDTGQSYGEGSEFFVHTEAMQSTQNRKGYETRKEGADQDILRVPYNFSLMVENARIEVEGWNTNIAEMAASTKKPSYKVAVNNNILNKDKTSKAAAPNIENTTMTASNAKVADIQDEPIDEKPIYYRAAATEIHWVQLLSECNTDEPGVLAEVITGPLRGIRLMGTCEITQSKRILLKMTVAVRNKESSEVNMIALDSNTLRASIPGKINNHYFSRYAPFILANFAGAYAESLISSTTITGSDGTDVQQVNNIPNEKDQLYYAGGKTLEALLPVWEQSLDRKATGTVKQHTVHMMMFTAPADII